MNRKQIEKIIAAIYKKIKTHAKCFAAGPDAEAIHLLRVEYKKLRALLKAVAFRQQHAKKTGALKKLKKLYHIAGTVRELQLQQQFIATATKNSAKKTRAYLHLLQQEITRLKKIPAPLSAKKIIADSKDKACKVLPAELSISKFVAYFKHQKTIAEALIKAGNISDENIHTIRKILKDFYFTLKVYQKYEAAGAGVHVKKIENYYYGLLKEMGSFCDTSAAIALLKLHLAKQPGIPERQLLQQVKKNWSKEKRQLKKSLVKKLTEEDLPLPY